MSRTLIGLGILLIAAGAAWPWIARLGLGRLPGDLAFNRPGFSLYAPIATCLVISAIVTVLAWIFRK